MNILLILQISSKMIFSTK